MLSSLLERAKNECVAMPAWEMRGDGSRLVSDVTNVSSEVAPGSLFCCVRGEQHDGHDFADEAVQRGASALLVDRFLPGIDVDQVLVGQTAIRRAMGCLAAAVHEHPSRRLRVIGVTGTNGKTTTAHMLGAILQRSGHRTKVLGTLSGARTTPESPALQRLLAAELRAGSDAVVMEVSSHAMALERVAGMHFAAAIFTNLGHDHLDFHRTHENYFAAKALLFQRVYTDRAVVNIDDPYGRKIADTTDVAVTTYSRDDIDHLSSGISGSSFRWKGMHVRIPVGGAFNVMNAVAAATTARELGVDATHIVSGLAELTKIPGRFERVDHGGGFDVVVDYAHTPEALRNVITTARESRGNHAARVIVVFGCGGDRDTSKRPDMGAAAVVADQVVVTSDNPRNEDPKAIIDAIVAGVPSDQRDRVVVEVDRRRAIEHAISIARSGDVVIIAGRGHETTQTVAGREIPFVDAQVAGQLLGVAR